MAWSAPMTAVAGAVFFAAEFNQYVRDNLNETGPAKVTTAGDLLVATGLNALGRYVTASNKIVTTQTTTSTSYVDLATVGPTVTLTTQARATVFWTSLLYGSIADAEVRVGVAVSGATTIAANASDMLSVRSNTGSSAWQKMAAVTRFTTLNAGSNTFTMKYATPGGGTGTFSDREIIVFPF